MSKPPSKYEKLLRWVQNGLRTPIMIWYYGFLFPIISIAAVSFIYGAISIIGNVYRIDYLMLILAGTTFILMLIFEGILLAPNIDKNTRPAFVFYLLTSFVLPFAAVYNLGEVSLALGISFLVVYYERFSDFAKKF